MTVRPLAIAVGSFVLGAPSLLAAQAAPGQGGFVPVESLPPSEQLPSAPLLIGAYAFVWLAATVYLFSIWKRLNKVESEMRSLEQKSARK